MVILSPILNPIKSLRFKINFKIELSQIELISNLNNKKIATSWDIQIKNLSVKMEKRNKEFIAKYSHIKN